ncbi:MAG: Gfo/Idh/MocA family protein [Streptosporangiaceae bacterium]
MSAETDTATVPVGIIGCGNIFERYVTGLRTLGDVDIVWCADLDVASPSSEARSSAFAAGSPDQALADELGAVDLVVNLTPPAAHAAVSTAVLHAGKHVYVEKPLATSWQAAVEVPHPPSALPCPGTPIIPPPAWSRARCGTAPT